MNRITLYSTGPGCNPCKAAKALLDRKGIPYDEVNITEDDEARERLRQNGFTMSPVIAYNGKLHTNADITAITTHYLESRS